MRAAKEATGDQALALHFGEAFDMTELSIVGLIGLAAESATEAYAQFDRFTRLIVDVEVDEATGKRFTLSRSDDAVWLIDTRKHANAFPEITESLVATYTEHGGSHHLGHRPLWIGDVLEDVKRRHHVEAARREGRREDVADVHLVAEPARHRGGPVVHLDPGHLPAQLARDTERRARAASHVEIAPGSSPRRTAPPEAAQERARPELRQNGSVRVAERAVPEPARERVPGGPYPGRRALERHPRRRLLVTRVVVRVARGQVLVATCDGVLYTIGFLLIGLPYAFLIGMVAIVLTMIPFLGAITTCATERWLASACAWTLARPGAAAS
jgi:hypothetical protein